MNKRKKSLLLASIASLCLLCGCGKETNEVVDIDGEQYVKNGEEYNKIDIAPRTFEPGEHIIYYSIKSEDTFWKTGYYEVKPGYNGAGNIVPETPEGYKLINVVSMSNANGITDVISFFYVNEVRVVVQGTFNAETMEVEYGTPGAIEDQKILEIGD